MLKKLKRLQIFWKAFLMMGVISATLFAFPGLTRASNEINTSDSLNDEPLLPLQLTGTNGDAKANLNWTDPNDLTNLSEYRIAYSLDSKVTFKPKDVIGVINVGKVKKYTVTGLENGKTYYFRLARVSLDGQLEAKSNIIALAPKDNVFPITTIGLKPSKPDGEKGWYVTVPKITFKTSEKAKTYYQWNSFGPSGWETYTKSFAAPEGENTIYYYSVDKAGNIEEIKWQNFKVDTVLPKMPALNLAWDESNQGLMISWLSQTGIGAYELWRISPEKMMIAELSSDELFYLDKSVSRGTSYQYLLIAKDLAGNSVKSALTSVTVPAPVISVVPAVSSSQKIVTPKQATKQVKKIEPSIGESGVSTIAQKPEPTREIEGANTETPNEPGEPGGWNRLLVALSILIIAAGASVGGYYGYEWMSARSQEHQHAPSKKRDNRW